MVKLNQPGAMQSLVDMDEGTISREIFVNTDIYQQELERVFARTWLYIGHESQIPNPNDFFISRMGEESVILTRDRQGEIHVLLNTCRHRGMKVCRYDEGNTPVFSCPYHGWSYSTDGNLVSVPGELIGVPQFATAYHGELEKEEWGLISVPKMANYHGSIWACWDKEAPDFLDYLGGMDDYLAPEFESREGEPGGLEAIGGVQKWLMPCNWKFAAENFIGDFYHVISHRSTDLNNGVIAALTQSKLQSGLPFSQEQAYVSFPGGHGVRGTPPHLWKTEEPYMSGSYGAKGSLVEDYLRHAHETRQKRYGGRGTSNETGKVATILPNMSTLDVFALTIAVWHPVGPMMTEAWRWDFIDKKAPSEVKAHWRDHLLTWSGPTGMVEEDDMENWNYATEASNGTIARRQPYHYGMGQRHERNSGALPDALLTSEDVTEQNQRGFYKRWAELMDAESWAALK